MMMRHYRFAGVEITISMPQDLFFENETRMDPFLVDSVAEPYRITVEKREKLAPPVGDLAACQGNIRIYCREGSSVRYTGQCRDTWEQAYARTEMRGKEISLQVREDHFPGAVGTKTVLETMAAEHLIARSDGFIFHCSYIDHQGKAILFTAPSETGKSTQAELWNRYRSAEIINGDRAAVRLVRGRLVAEGIPFAGSSQYCKNKRLPIAAIVYLGQAPKTTIRKIRGYEAFSKIWEGVSVNIWDKEDVERVSRIVQRTASDIPVFHLPCTPDESAVTALETALRELVNP